MKDPASLIDRLDLTTAVRILEHAGRPDPLEFGADPQAKLQALIDSLCDLSLHDGLTGLVNATFFHAALGRELDRSARTGRTCGLMLLDVDHFKAVNDTYGHRIGDMVLERLAHRLKRSLRSMDTAARIGGEEFAVILPECTPEDALRAALRIHANVSPLAAEAGTLSFTVTSSAGVVWTGPSGSSTAVVLLNRADRELYRAKHEGRNRLCHPPRRGVEVSLPERAMLSISGDTKDTPAPPGREEE